MRSKREYFGKKEREVKIRRDVLNLLIKQYEQIHWIKMMADDIQKKSVDRKYQIKGKWLGTV